MHKRLSIRLVTELSEDLSVIARKRGVSVNALVSEIAWSFVEYWKSNYGKDNPSDLKRY